MCRQPWFISRSKHTCGLTGFSLSCSAEPLSVPLAEQVVELDLHTVVPCCSGPKRPQDKVAVSDMKEDFETCLGAKVGNRSFWAYKRMHASKSCVVFRNYIL